MRRIALAFLAAKLIAQSFGAFTISGELHHAASVDPGALTVELVDPQSHLAITREMVSSSGDFQLRCPAAGTYEIRVLNRDHSILKTDYATVSPATGPISLNLPEPKDAKPPSGSVSIGELRRKPNPKALKEYRLAEKAKAKGRELERVQHLEAALTLDPDYAPAHNAMSEVFLTRQDYPMAAREFQEVARLCPALPTAHTNLAIALLHLRQFEGAEAEARTALKLAPDNPKARYLMGVSLVGQHRMKPADLLKMARPE